MQLDSTSTQLPSAIVFVGIVAPDFNLAVERRLKAAGHRTVHYVSPSVWAWRAKRAARMGESADRVLCLFPMEPPIYAAHGVDARFVGHPMADAMPLDPDRATARAGFGLPMHAHVLAVLPGSRLGEVARMGPPFLEAAARVRAAVPGLEVLVPAANAGDMDSAVDVFEQHRRRAESAAGSARDDAAGDARQAGCRPAATRLPRDG